MAQHGWISQNLDLSHSQSCYATPLSKSFFVKNFVSLAFLKHFSKNKIEDTFQKVKHKIPFKNKTQLFLENFLHFSIGMF